MQNLGLRANFAGRELHAVIDEVVAGRWTFFAGTMTNIVGTMAQANPLLTAQIAIVAALAAGVGYLAYQWIATANAIRSAEGEMLIVGQHGAGAVDQINSSLKESTSRWNLSKGTAREVLLLIESLHGPAADFKMQIQDAAAAQAKLTSGDVVKTTEELVKKFNEGGAGALKFADSIGLLDGKVTANNQTMRAHVDDLLKAGQQTAAMNIILQAMKDRYVGAGEALTDYERKKRDWLRSQVRDPITGMALAPMPSDLAPQKPPIPTQEPIDQQANQDRVATDNLSDAERRRTIVELELGAARRALEGIPQENTEARTRATEAVVTAEQKLAQIHTTTETQQHEATLSRLQQDLAANRDFADRRVPILKKIAEEETRYNTQASTQARAAQNQVVEGQRQASDMELRIKLAQIDEKRILVKNSAGAELAFEDQKLALLRQYGKEGTLEYQNELNARAALTVRAGNQGNTAAIEQLRAEQAAHAGDFTFQLQIEDQILAMLKAHYGAASVEYSRELKHREELLVGQAKQEEQVARQKANTARELSRIEAQVAQDIYRSQTRGGTFSLLEMFGGAEETDQFRQQMEQIVEAHGQAMEAIKEQQDKAINPLDMQRALDAETIEMAKFSRDVERSQTQAAESTRKAWENVADGMASSMANATTQMVTGQQTLLRGTGSIISSLMTKVLDFSYKMAGRWIADRFLELAGTQTAETGKTIATATGTAARSGIQGAAAASENAGFLVRAARWLATELGMTTATTTSAVTRTASEIAADTTRQATTAAVNAASAESYAALAAVQAASSVASTPFVGPALAVAAAASTLAAMQPYVALASLDVGAWNVPGDMAAVVHKGEMVVPATYSEGLRSQMSGGGASGGGMGTTVHFSPTINAGGRTEGLSENQMNTLMLRAKQEMVSSLWGTFRNGSLKLPGRR